MAKSVNYTYDDFLKTVDDNGLTLDQFSDADLQLAQSSPEAGIGLANSKRDYLAATTDSARAMANGDANEIRKSYGNYSGGENGMSYTPYGDTPSSFEYDEAPSFGNTYGGDVTDAYDTVNNYDDFTYDPYNSAYSGKINSQLGALENYGDFTYDPATDPLYSSYKKQYTREGQRALQDTLGTIAASTGGQPSSYAATAAGQANDYYMTQLGDKLPELYQLSYNEWSDEYNRQKSLLDEYEELDDTGYSRYSNDRSFDYGVYGDKYNRLQNNLDNARNLDATEYSRYRDDVGDWQTNRDFDYNQLLDQIDYNTNAEQTAYNRERDALSDKTDADTTAYNRAMDAANLGDYSQLAKYYNVDTTQAEQIYALNKKQAEADYEGTLADTAYTKASTGNVGASTSLSNQKYNDEQTIKNKLYSIYAKEAAGETLTADDIAYLNTYGSGYDTTDTSGYSDADYVAMRRNFASGTASGDEVIALYNAGYITDKQYDAYWEDNAESSEGTDDTSSEEAGTSYNVSYPKSIDYFDSASLTEFENQTGEAPTWDNILNYTSNHMGSVGIAQNSDGKWSIIFR